MMCRQAGQTCKVNCPPGLSPKGQYFPFTKPRTCVAVFPQVASGVPKRPSAEQLEIRHRRTPVAGSKSVDQSFPGGKPRNFALLLSTRTCMEWAGERTPGRFLPGGTTLLHRPLEPSQGSKLTRTYVHQSRETRWQANTRRETGAPSPTHMLEARLIEMIDGPGRGNECEVNWRRAIPETGPASSNPQFPASS